VAERSAAEQVKALVEAAEREAQQSRAAVERVAEHADELLRRVDELSAGVTEAAAALRREVEALREPEEAAPPPEGAAPVAEVPPPAEDPGTRVEAAADDELIAEAEAVAGRRPETDTEASAVPEGARLLALKMALDGRSREETAAYLLENFELADLDALLDEVYARAEARK
jgi:hypothetical protein